MSKYLVDDSSLTSVADAIRSKTDTSDNLSFPTGFVSAISDISTGGGDIDALIDGSITSITTSAAIISDYGLYNRNKLTVLNAPNVEEVGYAGLDGARVYALDFPLLTKAGNYAFRNNKRVNSVNFPLLKRLPNWGFKDCSPGLTNVYFPSVTYIGTECFMYCYYLARADFPNVTSISSDAFRNCLSLGALILRSESLCTADNSYILDNSLITNGTGYIYVPNALIEDYKVATNWTTYADQFRALEDYTVDGTTTGALDETKI